MARPAVDVVVPFRGDAETLRQLRRRLAALRLGPGDTIVIVENTPGGAGAADAQREGVPVLRAAGLATPGYARNRGAELGAAEWIVFFDADTAPPADLLERYFEPPPRAETVLLAGGVIDEAVGAGGPPAARYAQLRHKRSQEHTLALGRWAFAQTANLACRRTAFEALGGFREDIRAGEDADLSYRLRAAGGALERREHAAVVHRSRETLRTFLAQALLHGAGSAWLARTYPGAFPGRRRPGLLVWAVRFAARGALAAARRRDRDVLVVAIYEPLWELAYELGRSLPVERRAPGTARAPNSPDFVSPPGTRSGRFAAGWVRRRLRRHR